MLPIGWLQSAASSMSVIFVKVSVTRMVFTKAATTNRSIKIDNQISWQRISLSIIIVGF